jgi:hypothetical protein
MAGKTPTERINDLFILVTDITGRLDAFMVEVRGHVEEQKKVAESVAELKTKVALQQHQLEKLEKGGEEWGRRAWQIIAGIVIAVASGVIGYLLKK